MRGSSIRSGLVPFALLAAGCAGPGLQPVEPSPEAVLLTVPAVPQDELYECGLASISALCLYHGVQIPPGERARLVEIAGAEHGLSGAELRAALEASGLEVFVFHGALDHSTGGLFRHVDRGRPLLVMLSVDDERFHYCLFTGYDPTNRNVFLLDPRRGSMVLPEDAFAMLWDRAERFTLLCTPREGSAETRTP